MIKPIDTTSKFLCIGRNLVHCTGTDNTYNSKP